jgi:hypothetical protein
VPNLSERRRHAWTALAAEPAVRAAERAIVTTSANILVDTLAVSIATEARTRVARVHELREEAEHDRSRRAAYQRAADDLRHWAAAVYLAALSDPRTALDERSVDAAAEGQPSSSTTSSRRRPPGASAATTSPTRRPRSAAPIGDSREISPAAGSLSPALTTR